MTDDDPYAEIVQQILEDEDEHWMATDWARSMWANFHSLSEQEKRNNVGRLVDMAHGDYELPDPDTD